MIQHLGSKKEKLLIFGGPYSNLHALQALKVEAGRLGIPARNIICTGDLVGYCAFPDEAVRFVEAWGIHSIAGNVEFNLREEADDCGCNFSEGSRCDLLSRQWFPYAQSRISKEAMAYLQQLPAFITFDYCEQRYFVLHGAHKNTSEFIFRSTPWSVKADNFRTTGADVILAGHCGLPFAEENDGKKWINAGVIGMPANDGTTTTWYAVLEDATCTFHRLPYDYKAAHAAMQAASLPTAYAQTLIDGIWDNCDILPDVETNLQGVQIVAVRC